MAQRIQTKTTFAPAKVIQPIYTRGSVALSQNGRILATCLDEDVLLTDLRTGEELARIEGDGEIITTLAITPSGSHIILCSRSLSMRIYSLTPSISEDGSIEPELLRTLKPHASPVVTCAVDHTGSLFASGGADGIVKVWDISGGFVTHVFHGHSGVISALRFFEVDTAGQKPEESKKRKRKSKAEETDGLADETTVGLRLASGGEDGKVRIWNLHKRNSAAVLDAHVSVVRTLDYSLEENALLSGSRDKTIIVWDVKTWKVRSTIPVLEEVESAGFLKDGQFIYTGGETARLRIWLLSSGTEITQEQEEGTETEAIQEIIHCPGLPYILSVHADQTLILHSTSPLNELTSKSIPPLPILRRISGTHGQIIDVAYVGRGKSLLALATNSEEVRIVSLKDTATNNEDESDIGGNYFGADVALLKGHDDIIICMDCDWSGNWLATGSRDNTARLWQLDPSSGSYTCYAIFTGHAESLGAVALPRTIPSKDTPAYQSPLDYPPSFLITGSQDKTVKRWDVPKPSSDSTEPTTARATYTRKAHDKDINAIATNPSSTLFASASQDRTVKIWATEDGSTLGVLRGHKRGVWTVSFSPTGTNLNIPGSVSGANVTGTGSRGHILTGSGDKTVRIWSLSDYSCIMTMEGHTNSVLKVLWLPLPTLPDGEKSHDKRGALIASAGGDGLVKIWEAQSGECAATLDNHTDRVWALTARSPSKNTSDGSIGESLISGAGDGVLTFWRDTTTATATEARTKETQRIELDQKLDNHIYGQNWREAIVLALQLDQPARLLHLFKTVIESPDFERGTWTGNAKVDGVVAGLADEQVWKLLCRVRDWNTNARNSLVAQRVLRAVFEGVGVERLVGLKVRGMRGGGGSNLRDLLGALTVYGERHFGRVCELWDESFLVEFTLGEMDGLLAGKGDGVVSGVNGVNGINGVHGINIDEEEERDVIMI
ncbi:U3 small nucleolar RNA-associated protein 13 [Tothia fuscella]|uniref:U3 small nucleolar RNA-associated protein 13 n=1 Tax=Tothia fuscella TaxID=1048955 RepID=A0A9P4P1J9_9PEZI|nr:U3 small nucleolar RNA-associated protein 13 [Tothia fuscella]